MNAPRFIAADTPGFPLGLQHVNPPINGVWTLGPDPFDARLVAVVGTRRPTAYGVEAATKIARDLAIAGVTVVSGLALGIDTAAHVGALSAAGRTIAVLAGGVDRPMPPQNRWLYDKILDSGGSVISEQPPGEGSYKVRYLERNRIIAAMSAAVVVVQAGVRSGATNTANWAVDHGIDVFGVPGDLRADASVGVHNMLKSHGHLCTGAADVLRVLDWKPGTPTTAAVGEHAGILDAVRGGASTLDALAARTGKPIPDLLRALTSLELDGHLTCNGARYTVRI